MNEPHFLKLEIIIGGKLQNVCHQEMIKQKHPGGTGQNTLLEADGVGRGSAQGRQHAFCVAHLSFPPFT